MNGLKVFSGNANLKLAQDICLPIKIECLPIADDFEEFVQNVTHCENKLIHG